MSFDELRQRKLSIQTRYKINAETIKKLLKNAKITQKVYQSDIYFGSKDDKDILRLRLERKEKGCEVLKSFIYKGQQKARKDKNLIRPMQVICEQEDLKKMYNPNSREIFEKTILNLTTVAKKEHNRNMKIKYFFSYIVLIFCLLLPISGKGFVMATSDIPEKVVVSQSTYIYKDADIKGEILKDDTGKYITLKQSTTLIIDITFFDSMFYKFCLENIIDGKTSDDYGFVLIAHTVDYDKQSPQKKLDSNASVKNDNSEIFTKDTTENDKYTKTDIVLKKGTKVKILDGYNKDKQYTYISFYDENNNIVSYYIQTKDLAVSGVNYSLIVGIMSLITCVSIILILFGIKGKKKKLLKK
jgi:hypothetical protein